MTVGLTKTLPSGRVIRHVPPQWLRPRCRRLKRWLDPHVPEHSLDHCWLKGRQRHAAYSMVQPGWEFIDIERFFATIDHGRVRKMIGRLDSRYLYEFDRMCELLGCDTGIPEGCSFSPTLANLFLAPVDKRWAGKAVRVGDNWATSNSRHLSQQLSDLGLSTQQRQTFTKDFRDHREGGIEGHVDAVQSGKQEHCGAVSCASSSRETPLHCVPLQGNGRSWCGDRHTTYYQMDLANCVRTSGERRAGSV